MSSDTYYRPRYILDGRPQDYERTDRNPLYYTPTHERDRLVDKSFLPNQLPQVDESIILDIPQSRLLDRIFTEPERRRWRGLWNPEDLNVEDPEPVPPSRPTERLLHLNVYPDGTPKTHSGLTDPPTRIKLGEELANVNAQINQLEKQIRIAPDVDKQLLNSILGKLFIEREKLQEAINPNFRLEKGINNLAQILKGLDRNIISQISGTGIQEPPSYQLGDIDTTFGEFDFDTLADLLIRDLRIPADEAPAYFARFTNISESVADDILEGKQDASSLAETPKIQLGSFIRTLINQGVDRADLSAVLSSSGIALSPDDESKLEELYTLEFDRTRSPADILTLIERGTSDINTFKGSREKKSELIGGLMERIDFAIRNGNINKLQSEPMLNSMNQIRIRPANKFYQEWAKNVLILEFIKQEGRPPSQSDIDQFNQVGNRVSIFKKLRQQIRDGSTINASA